ncbi:MAG: urease accessory UreF family protein, partial [Pseudomonadota bacterium]|nr:urease accessory UreF family protein [Pseudomonadota bacterium]
MAVAIVTITMIDSLALARLLQLASPALPVGGYSYSQGLEWAIEEGTVHNAASAEQWIGDVLECSLASFELPLLWRLCHAWQLQDEQQVNHWNEFFCAGRETAESHAETLQMGYSLRRLLQSLAENDGVQLQLLQKISPISFPTAYAYAVASWKIPIDAALQAYAWSWLENQISAAIKTIPLGQTDGQRILFALASRLPQLITDACTLKDDE